MHAQVSPLHACANLLLFCSLVFMQAKVEDLVAQHLQQRLEILPEEDLALALHNFVDKDEKGALVDCVSQALNETQRAAIADSTRAPAPAGPEDADVASVVSLCVQHRKATRVSAENPVHNNPIRAIDVVTGGHCKVATCVPDVQS